MRSRVRGCSGRSDGNVGGDLRQRVEQSLEHVGDGRRSTAGAACRARTPRVAEPEPLEESASLRGARGSVAASRSSGCRRSGCARRGRPSRARLSAASRQVVKSTSESASATTRFTSSGMSRSRLRSPASTCASTGRTGRPLLAEVDLRRHQGARRRRVDVADDDHDVGPLRLEHLLEADHHPGGLRGVRSRSDAEVDSRLRTGRGRGRRRPTCCRRSAGRCAPAPASNRSSPRSRIAHQSGAIFM